MFKGGGVAVIHLRFPKSRILGEWGSLLAKKGPA